MFSGLIISGKPLQTFMALKQNELFHLFQFIQEDQKLQILQIYRKLPKLLKLFIHCNAMGSPTIPNPTPNCLINILCNYFSSTQYIYSSECL